MSVKTGMYGVWNSQKKEFVFGIQEESKNKALKKLQDRIGNDARKWKFVPKAINDCEEHKAMFGGKLKNGDEEC